MEKIRRGKASAVNLILKNASGKIIVFIDADNLPKIGSINKLILPFSNDGIGGATSRVIPLTKSYIVNLTWNLHHKINLVKPKVNGQFYAIRRNIIDNIPHDIICDDAYIEAMLRKKNYKTVYVSEAVTYAQTPKKLQNILKQRRRISRGYIQLFDMGLDVSIPYKTKLELVAKEMQKKPLDFPKIFLAVLIETSANILAYYDTLNKKTPYCWEKVT